jgi:hypothetical protein
MSAAPDTNSAVANLPLPTVNDPWLVPDGCQRAHKFPAGSPLSLCGVAFDLEGARHATALHATAASPSKTRAPYCPYCLDLNGGRWLRAYECKAVLS